MSGIKQMKNSIVARIEFDFKGERFTPSATIDLDELMEKQGCIASLYPIIAHKNDIDAYSYHYEVMEQEDIKFDHAEGMVTNYLNNCVLDVDGFEKKWHEMKIYVTLKSIAKRYMDIDDLEQHPKLMNALIEAFRCGEAIDHS
jgi:hypothetical protein